MNGLELDSDVVDIYTGKSFFVMLKEKDGVISHSKEGWVSVCSCKFTLPPNL